MVKLDEIIQYGDLNDYLMYIERAKRLGLVDEAAHVEQEMLVKRSEVSNWLTQAVQNWEADRCSIENNIEEAKKIGLEDIATATEAAISAREKLITESVEISIDKGLKSSFEQWIKHAERMGMEELVDRSLNAFKEKTQVIKLALLEAATCGSKEQFISASDKAHSLGLASEVKRCVQIVRKRAQDLLDGAATLATESVRSGVLHSDKWYALKVRAGLLGISEDVLDHVRESVFEAEGGCASESLRDDHGEKRHAQEVSEFAGAHRYIPVWSMMQNWKEMKQVRRNWQMEMVEEEQGQISANECLASSSKHNRILAAEDKGCDYSSAESRKIAAVASPREQTDYESDGEEKHDFIRSEENREMEAILSLPLILTQLTLEQKMNCSEANLQWLTKVEINHEGLSSLGDGVISECCPNAKIFACDMNRLTTLKFAFLGCEMSVEHISARNNFIADVSELETLYNLETLHLDGNNISSLGQAVSGSRKVSAAAEFPMQTNCWPRLREFSLSCNRITRVTRLGKLCPNLQVLDLGSNHLVTMGGPQGNALVGLRHLRVLDVGQNRLKGRSLWEALKNCPLLISLVASRNRLTELPSFSGSALLRELWLNGNAIRRLSCLAWMPNLQRLYLQDNSIETLEPLWGCPVLEVLDLSFNSISDLSQLRQLACFLHLRSLQLNDNPVSEQADYVDTVLEAVPWLMELDNEAVSESSKNRAVKRIYLKVVGSVGMQYLHEKTSREEIVISGSGKPDEVQKIIVGCRTHQKLAWFHNLHSESVISAGGHCQDNSCSGKYVISLKAFHNGAASRAVLWAVLFETTLFERTRTALRRLLEDDGCGKGLVLSDDLEAKQDVFASIEMCFRQREKLLLANKDLSNEREVVIQQQPDLDEISDPVRRDTSSCASFRRGIDELEFCLQQHIDFQTLPKDDELEFKCLLRKEEFATRIQAAIRCYLSRLRYLRFAKAVCRIQAIWKGWKLRQSWKFLSPWRNSQSRNAGVALLIKVQAVWRAHVLRRRLRNALASSKYVDEDGFDYDAIDETEFFVGTSAVDSCIPDLIFEPGMNSRSSESASDLLTPDYLPIFSDEFTSRPCSEKQKHQEDTIPVAGEAAEKKNTQMSQIAEEWGFKDEKTVKQFLKACKKGKKPSKVSKPIVQGAQKRLEIFKAKAEAPNEHQVKQQIEKIMLSVSKRPEKQADSSGLTTPELGKSTPPLEKDVLKPSVYLFGIPTH